MESSDSKIILRAMADIRRRHIVATKANPATGDLYDNAFVHAILHWYIRLSTSTLDSRKT
jgi:hypothetical protein